MEDIKGTETNEGTDLESTIQSVQFSQPASQDSAKAGGDQRNMDMILDISVPISVELGRTNMLVKDILALTQGSIVELDKVAGTPVDLLVRGKLIAQGEVVVVDENFGLKITNICGSEERVRNLG